MATRLFFLLFLPLVSVAQTSDRLQPGKMYDGGEALYAPRYGIRSVVPMGWSGLLPRESEVFLLTSQTAPIEIFVFARDKGELTAMKKDWNAGFDLDDNIRLKATGADIQNGVLSSEVVTEGPKIDKSRKGYAASRCSESGPCLTCLAVTGVSDFEEARKVVDDFIRATRFEPPSTASPYASFDWKKFLAGKQFIMYAVTDGGSKETEISFCGDGTFKANAVKRGIMKNQNPAYRGNQSGTWQAEGVGETGKLTLAFKKKDLAPMEVTLKISDEKIYANEDRYFVADYPCK